MKKYLLLLILLSVHAHAEWVLILDDHNGSIASDGERLYAATEESIYYSRDDGDTWRQSSFKHNDAEKLTASPGVVYGFSWDHGIIRSVTKGNTWHPKNDGFDRVWNGDRFYYPQIRQFFVTGSGMAIAIGYLDGTWISHDHGDSWHNVTLEWVAPQRPRAPDIDVGAGIWSMSEFDGYLWVAYLRHLACRSSDAGATWEKIPYWVEPRSIAQFGSIQDWVAFRDNLYVAGLDGFGRWREEGLEWENLIHGLPESPRLSSLVVHRDRIFAGSWNHGVFMFDHHAETWYPAGLSNMAIYRRGLVTHRGDLYASAVAAAHNGIYRANLQFVSPEGKAAVTWGAIKLENTK